MSQRHKGSVQSGKDGSSGSYAASHGHAGRQRAVCGGSPTTFAALHTGHAGRSFSPEVPSLPSADHVLRDVVVMSCRPTSRDSPSRRNAAFNASSSADFRRAATSTAKSTCEAESWSRSITWSTVNERIVTSPSPGAPTRTDVPTAKPARRNCREALWPIAQILGGVKPPQSSGDSALSSRADAQERSTNALAIWRYNGADLADSWYKGALTREEAESVATRLNLNIFLYSRLSSSVVSADQESNGIPLFLCSVSASGQPRHYQVQSCKMASGDVYYYLTDFPDEPWFPMLKQLLRFYEACA
ncbi:hypothetical protein AAVH_05177 [Aphelenchoides avenae]|nr:hypothetical protein AAVH_05177 [Aphelenchus avenae]